MSSEAPSRTSKGVPVLLLCAGVATLCIPTTLFARQQRDDSAGVEIVENTPRSSQAVAAWCTAPEPDFTIGRAVGSPGQELFDVTSARMLPSGVVLLANAGTGELRFFRDDGSYVRSVGGRGRGPGEYSRPIIVPNFADDSIVVHDANQSRVSVLGPDGTFARSFRVRAPARAGMAIWGDLLARNADGTFLLRQSGTLSPTTPGVYRPDVAYVILDAEGSPIDTVTVRLGNSTHYSTWEGHPIFATFPFLPGAYAVADGQHLFYADSKDYALEVYDLRGRLQRIVRTDHTTERLDRSAYDTWVRSQLDALPSSVPDEARAATRQYYDRLFESWELPAHGTLAVDRDGRIWVAHFRVMPQARQFWDVFAGNGSLMALARLPSGMIPLDIGTDYVLGLLKDADDVEYVERFALVTSHDTGGSSDCSSQSG